MKAVVQHRYGGVEQLEVTDIDAPEAAAGEVLVRVRAAGIERGTVHLMTGLPLVGRAALGLRRPRCARPRPRAGRASSSPWATASPGSPSATRSWGSRAGAQVAVAGHGALAELTRAVEDGLVAKPAALSFERGGHGAGLREHRPPGGPRPRPGRGRAAGAGDRRLRRRRVVRRAAGDGVRRGGHRASAARPSSTWCGSWGPSRSSTTPAAEPTGVFDVVLDLAGNRPVRRLRRAAHPDRDPGDRRRRGRRTVAGRTGPAAGAAAGRAVHRVSGCGR